VQNVINEIVDISFSVNEILAEDKPFLRITTEKRKVVEIEIERTFLFHL
jgi:hypothetical protein